MEKVRDETYPCISADPRRTPNDTYNDVISNMVTLTLQDRIVMKQDSFQTHVTALNDGEVLKYHNSFCFIIFIKYKKKLERLLLVAAAAAICFFKAARHPRHKFYDFVAGALRFEFKHVFT